MGGGVDLLCLKQLRRVEVGGKFNLLEAAWAEG